MGTSQLESQEQATNVVFIVSSDRSSYSDTGRHKLGGILKAWLAPEFYPQSAHVEILATFATKMP